MARMIRMHCIENLQSAVPVLSGGKRILLEFRPKTVLVIG